MPQPSLSPASDLRLVLRAFDDATVPPGSSLRAAVARAGTRLSLRWTLDGPPGAWVMPAPSAAPARRERLWESTCFEAFVAPAGRTQYWEVNLSPAGDWNVYRFDGYRDGMRPESRVAPPSFEVATDRVERFTVATTLDLAPIAELASAPLDVGITAVLESVAGPCSYWALRHAGVQADFHLRESFVVRLAP